MDQVWVVFLVLVLSSVGFCAGVWAITRLFGGRCRRCGSYAMVRVDKLRFTRAFAGIYYCRNCGARGLKLFQGQQ